jgi:hypothetical protein
MHIDHPFSKQLKEDFNRLTREYLVRYSEPALWYSYRMALPKAIDDASADLDPDRVGQPTPIRVLALLPNDFHIQRYGITPEGLGICFADVEMRVDDRLVLLDRIFPRDTWAKPKSIDPAKNLVVFAVPSFYPLEGQWEQGVLIRHSERHLQGTYTEQPSMMNRYYIRYDYAYVLRVKSIGASWRIEGEEHPVFSYHVSIQDE